MSDSVRFSDLSLSSFTSTILSYLSYVLQFYILCQNTWEPASMREVEWIASSSPREPQRDGNLAGLCHFVGWQHLGIEGRSSTRAAQSLFLGSEVGHGPRDLRVSNFWKPKDHPTKNISLHGKHPPKKMDGYLVGRFGRTPFWKGKGLFSGAKLLLV